VENRFIAVKGSPYPSLLQPFTGYTDILGRFCF